MKKLIRYFWLLSLRKFRHSKRRFDLHLLIFKMDIQHEIHWWGMYFRSRERIRELKTNPPIKDSDPRLNLDLEAMTTMTREKRDYYMNWIFTMRQCLHDKEEEQYFSPEFREELARIRKQRKLIESLRA